MPWNRSWPLLAPGPDRVTDRPARGEIATVLLHGLRAVASPQSPKGDFVLANRCTQGYTIRTFWARSWPCDGRVICMVQPIGKALFGLWELWWAVVDSNHIYLCRRQTLRRADEIGKSSKRETGCNAPSTNHSVKFIYRLG